MKIVPNAQTNFEEMLVKKRLLCSHLKQEVIKIQYVTSKIIDLYEYEIILISFSRWPRSNRLYTNVSSKFVCVLSTIFVFMVRYKQ